MLALSLGSGEGSLLFVLKYGTATQERCTKEFVQLTGASPSQKFDQMNY